MAGAPHRMLVLDPFVGTKRVSFGSVGVGFRRGDDGKNHWHATFTTGTCVEAKTDVFSATHTLGEKSTRFTAVYYPSSDDVKLEYARVIVEDEPHMMTKDYPARHAVLGHYHVDVAHASDGLACRAYWFEFAHTTSSGELRFSRYPEAGALMTTGENNGALGGRTCNEGWDLEGISLEKRAANNPLLTDIDIQVTSTSRVENFLEGNDTSMNGRVEPHSIAATEAVRFSFRVDNRGFRNATEAAAKSLDEDYQVVVGVVCTAPSGGASIASLVLSARFANNTQMPDVGSTVGSDLVLTWTTPLLNKSESATLFFRIVTDSTTQNGEIECVASILSLRDSNNAAVLEPELFDNGVNLNTTQTALVERRTDIVVGSERSQRVAVAGGEGAARVIEFVVSVTNKGPINATDLIVGFVVELAHDVVQTTPLTPSNGTVVAQSPLVFAWTIGTLEVGETATLTVAYSALAGAEEGEQGRIRSYVRSLTERAIFIFDDLHKNSINVRREIGLQLSHQLVVRTILEDDLERADTVEFVLFVDNHGPSDSAGVTIEIAFNMPHNVEFSHYETDGTGELLPQQRQLIGKHGKQLLPKGDFYFWVAGKLNHGHRKRLRLVFKATHKRAGSSPLQVGAAVVRRLTQEQTLLNDNDASLLVFQPL
jgi:hypothetical protein